MISVLKQLTIVQHWKICHPTAGRVVDSWFSHDNKLEFWEHYKNMCQGEGKGVIVIFLLFSRRAHHGTLSTIYIITMINHNSVLPDRRASDSLLPEVGRLESKNSSTALSSSSISVTLSLATNVLRGEVSDIHKGARGAISEDRQDGNHVPAQRLQFFTFGERGSATYSLELTWRVSARPFVSNSARQFLKLTSTWHKFRWWLSVVEGAT